MRRRALLFGGAALAAVGVGAGTALWRGRPRDVETAAPPLDLWALTFQRLEGNPLTMASWRGRPLLLNFWATWCAPCVTEMPLLDRFAREHEASGWQVLALAIDQPDPVRKFVRERQVRMPIAFGGSDGIELSRSLGNDHGALPFTAVFDSSGARRQTKLGAVSADLLATWAREIR